MGNDAAVPHGTLARLGYELLHCHLQEDPRQNGDRTALWFRSCYASFLSPAIECGSVVSHSQHVEIPPVCLPSWSLGYKYASCLPDCEQEPENELTVGVVIAAWVNGKLGAGAVKIYELFHPTLWGFSWNALWFYMYSSRYLVGGIVCKRCLNFFSPDKKNPLWSGIAISVSSDYWINLFYSKISWFFSCFWQIHLYIRLISHDPNPYIMVPSWSYNTECVFSLTILPLLIFIPSLLCIILLYCFLQENSNLLHLIWAECFLSCFL